MDILSIKNIKLYRGNRVAIGIPCFNEAVTISKVISDLHKEVPYAYIYTFLTIIQLMILLSLLKRR